MKTILKKFIIVLFLGLTTCFQNFAFGQRIRRTIHPVRINPARIARIQTRLMETRIHLQPEQSNRVEAINTGYLNKLLELQENTGLSQDEKIKALGSLRESKKNALKQVLDENQYKEYLKLHKELQEQRAKRIGEEGSSEPEGSDD